MWKSVSVKVNIVKKAVAINFTGIGTVVNTLAIIVGCLLGFLFQRLLNDKLQKTIIQAIGVSVIFIGISGTLSHMLVINGHTIGTQGALMVTISLTLGSFIGELLGIDAWFTHLGNWLRKRAGASGDSLFVEGFVSATLTVCVGAMAIIGPIQDALEHDPTMLFTKAILDGVIIAIYTASFGLGAAFSALPVFVFQITVTFLAVLINQFLTPAMTAGISTVGSMMIFCIGINLLFDTKIRVANMLPGLLAVVGYVALF